MAVRGKDHVINAWSEVDAQSKVTSKVDSKPISESDGEINERSKTVAKFPSSDILVGTSGSLSIDISLWLMKALRVAACPNEALGANLDDQSG